MSYFNREFDHRLESILAIVIILIVSGVSDFVVGFPVSWMQYKTTDFVIGKMPYGTA